MFTTKICGDVSLDDKLIIRNNSSSGGSGDILFEKDDQWVSFKDLGANVSSDARGKWLEKKRDGSLGNRQCIVVS